MARRSDNPLAGREILLCATGGIACYKAADLTSTLVQTGAKVHVAMTESAQRFVGAATFQALTRRKVYTSLWEATEDYRSQHLSLTESADLILIAPATANTLAKMAAGIADDLVSTLALSAWLACSVLVAPAMNTRMWNAPVTQRNIKQLQEWGANIIGPGEGRLACDTVGPGRMAEPEEIFDRICEMLPPGR